MSVFSFCFCALQYHSVSTVLLLCLCALVCGEYSLVRLFQQVFICEMKRGKTEGKGYCVLRWKLCLQVEDLTERKGWKNKLLYVLSICFGKKEMVLPAVYCHYHSISHNLAPDEHIIKFKYLYTPVWCFINSNGLFFHCVCAVYWNKYIQRFASL